MIDQAIDFGSRPKLPRLSESEARAIEGQNLFGDRADIRYYGQLFGASKAMGSETGMMRAAQGAAAVAGKVALHPVLADYRDIFRAAAKVAYLDTVAAIDSRADDQAIALDDYCDRARAASYR